MIPMSEQVDKDQNGEDAGEHLQVARRLQNIEQLIETIGQVADKGVESWSQSQKRKAEGEEHARNVEDMQHRRACWILAYACALVFGLAAFSLWKDQYELVRLILSSSLAVAAGAGLTSVFRAKKPSGK
jgi:hypothetical protein